MILSVEHRTQLFFTQDTIGQSPMKGPGVHTASAS